MNKWDKVEKTNRCWKWTGANNGDKYGRYGYGRIRIAGKNIPAHKYFYELLIGNVPSGLELDHLCFNRLCVRPEHLEPVTRSENLRRSWAKRIKNKPNCPSGHPFSGSNLYAASNKRTNRHQRVCKKCHNESNRRYRVRRAANL